MELTKEQIKEFIDTQPDNRPVEMGMSWVRNDEDCGCLLVHVYRHFNPEYKGEIQAGYNAHVGLSNKGFSIKTPNVSHFIEKTSERTTYKDLKKLAKTWA